VGVMNDLLEPSFGDQSIRYSMLLIAATAALAGLSFLLAERFIAEESENSVFQDAASSGLRNEKMKLEGEKQP
jgi:hypothetical protein